MYKTVDVVDVFSEFVDKKYPVMGRLKSPADPRIPRTTFKIRPRIL